MPRRLEADRELVKQLWLQRFKTSEISAQTGVKPKTIQTWRSRYGWRKNASDTRLAVKQTGEKTLSLQACEDLAQRAKALRAELATILEAQARLMAENPPTKVSQLANTPKGQGRASVLKTLVEA